MIFVMKTNALTSTVFALTVAALFSQEAQGSSDIEFLRARTDAHERKISQLEKELIQLKSYHAGKPGDRPAAAPSTPPSAPAASSAKAGEYKVKKGDILTRIAYRHKTTVAAIMKANGLRNDRIQIGQKLRIPGASIASIASGKSGKSGKAVAAAATPVVEKDGVRKSSSIGRPLNASGKPLNTGSSSKHVVKSGETFYSISRQYKVSVQSLVAANPSVRPTSLRVGQSLVVNGRAKSAPVNQSARNSPAKSAPKTKKIAKEEAEYVDDPDTKASTKKVVRNAPADRAAAKPSPTSTQSSSEPAIRTITVYRQMTYGQFASKHGASTTELNALNGLSLSKNTMLAKGSELYVPQF
jgi:LysM repeat protein